MTKPNLQFPAISEKHLAFVHEGDIWVVDKEAFSHPPALACRLTSAAGQESGPCFSPDGKWIAYSGNSHGSLDIYLLPTAGGKPPQRLTHHPGSDVIVDWVDGELFGDSGWWILFASQMQSGVTNVWQLFRVSVRGGMPRRLPLSIAEYGAVSPQGWLAFQTVSRDFAPWWGYRGGLAPEIYLWKIGTNASPFNLTRDDAANDSHPMWSEDGQRLYFLTDRGPKPYHLQVYDWGDQEISTAAVPELRRVVACEKEPIRNPSILRGAGAVAGVDELAFEAGGRLFLSLEKEGYQPSELDIHIPGDRSFLQTRIVNVADHLRSFDLSPNGDRAVFEARGRLFTMPVDGEGVIRPLSPRRPVQQIWPDAESEEKEVTVAERYPSWSPDGEYLAYFTDATGENELAVRPSKDSGAGTILTALGQGYRYHPHWSPDGLKIAFLDQRRHLQFCTLTRQEKGLDLREGPLSIDDQISWIDHSGLENFRLEWSPCSRWLAYARQVAGGYDAIFLFDTECRHSKPHQLTSGFHPAWNPVFHPTRPYLFFLTTRKLSLDASRWDGGWMFDDSTQIAALPLAPDAPPLMPLGRSDGQQATVPTGEDGAEAQGAVNQAACFCPADPRYYERRLQILPRPAAGNIRGLRRAQDRLIYSRFTTTENRSQKVYLHSLEFATWKETMLAEGKTAGKETFLLASGAHKILFRSGDRFLPLAIREGQQLKNITALPTRRLEALISPLAEWRQLFRDAWRIQRDFMFRQEPPAESWSELLKRHALRMEGATSRRDLNQILADLFRWLQISHTSSSRGELQAAVKRSVGLLGVDFKPKGESTSEDDGGFEICRIIEAAPWDSAHRSPLATSIEIGQKRWPIAVGDRLIAVNGVSAQEVEAPWQLLDGLAEDVVELRIRKGKQEGTCRVRTLSWSEEKALRYQAWVEVRRLFVDRKTDHGVGYIHIRNTSFDGFDEFYAQYRAQSEMKGLIFDARFNNGGTDPFGFQEFISGAPIAVRPYRYGAPRRRPQITHIGPKVLLVNSWTGSNGEILAYDFKTSLKNATVLGSRTYGGTIGTGGAPALIDSGRIGVPNRPILDLQGKRVIAESTGGIAPDGPGHGPGEAAADDPYLLDDDIDQPASDAFLAPAIDHILNQFVCGAETPSTTNTRKEKE